MGRSVNYLTGAESVEYIDVSQWGAEEKYVCSDCKTEYYEDEATECEHVCTECGLSFNDSNKEMIVDYWLADEEWKSWIKCIQYDMMKKYPSLSTCNKYEGNEVHIILESDQVQIAVSEYCGLASLSIRVHEDCVEYGLAERNISFMAKFMEKFGELRKLGTFSNGEGVFERRGA